MRTGRRRYPVRSARRPHYAWANFRAASTALGAGAGAIDTPLGAYRAEVGLLKSEDYTITRIRGELTWSPDAAANAEFAFGITVADPDTGFSVLQPDAHPHRDWMFIWDSFHLAASANTGVPIKIPIDIRSKRKVRDMEDDLLLVTHNNGAQALHWTGFLRVLMQTGH